GRVSRAHRTAARAAAAGAYARAARDQVGARRHPYDGGVLRRATARESRVDRGRLHAANPHRAQRADLPRDRLAAAADVRWALRRRGRVRKGVADAGNHRRYRARGAVRYGCAKRRHGGIVEPRQQCAGVLRPFVGQTGDPQHAWLVVAMASTLAGNLTVLGSVANLIVVQLARAEGVTIGFWGYFQ